MRIFQCVEGSVPRIGVLSHGDWIPSFDILVDGVSAGFAGTFAISAVMLVNDRFSFIPQVDLISELRHIILILTGWKIPFLLAWLVHLILGSYVLGATFGVVSDYLDGSPVVHGILFGLAIWLSLMLIAFPLLGYGFFGFGMASGAAPAAATLALNLVYGLALGMAFASVHPVMNLGND